MLLDGRRMWGIDGFCISLAEKGFSAERVGTPAGRAAVPHQAVVQGARTGPASPSAGILLCCQFQTNPFYLLVQVSLP